MEFDEVNQLADQLFAAIEAGDVKAVATLYADDIQIWHNTSGKAQSKDENLALLAGLTSRAEAWSYEQVRRRCDSKGCSQQHVLVGKMPNRDPFEIAVSIVLEMSGGKIRRIDEYLDSANLAALFG